MISTDRKIFEDSSQVRARMVEYGKLFDELHIIVFSREPFEKKISDRVWVYSTNVSKLFWISEAIKTGKKIVNRDFALTTQDPFETAIVGYRIASKFHIPLQIQAHTDFLSPQFARHSMKNLVRVKIAKIFLRRANRIRAVSRRVKESIIKELNIGGDIIDVLPIFIEQKNTDEIDLGQKYPKFDKIIITASRLTKEKNLFFALAVFKEVLKNKPNTGFVILGDGELRRNLENRAAKMGVSPNVKFEGWVDNPSAYYKSADLYLNTSLYEGYGISLVEAALSGLPIVSSDVGVMGYELKNSHICSMNDKNCYLKSVISALEKDNRASIKLCYKDKKSYSEEFKKSFDRILQ